MARIASLKDFVDDELARAPDLARRLHAATLRALAEPRRAPGDAPDRVLGQRLADAMPLFVEAFVASLRSTCAGDAAAAAPAAPATLELLDHDALDADIEISRTMQLIDGACEWEQRELAAFTSALDGRRYVDVEANPLRAAAYAAAAWGAVAAVVGSPAQRGALLRVVAVELGKLLKHAWAAASSRLEAQGVTPSEYRTVIFAPAGSSAGTRAGSGAGAAGRGGLAAPGLRAGTVAPAGAGDSRWLRALLVELPAGPAAAPPADTLIELLFEQFAADDQVPGAARDAIARLRVPMHRLARLDERLFETLAHAAWRLVDTIAAETEGARAGDAWAAAMLREAQQAASEVAAAEAPVAAVWREALAHLLAAAEGLLDARRTAVQATVARLELAERREQLFDEWHARLHARLAPLHLGAAVRRFVLEDWCRVLAEAALAGPGAPGPAAAAVAATDDLLWSLAPPDHPQSRQRLLKILPPLLERLREGLAWAGVPEARRQAGFDALMKTHAAALQGRAGHEPSAREIVEAMREEVLDDAPAAFGDSLIDVGTLATVPAELVDAGAERGAAIDAWSPGELRRAFLHRRWQRVRLLWRSPKGRYVLLLGDDGRPQAATRRALDRLAAAGLLRAIETRPLVARTIDRLGRRLLAP